MSTLEPPAGGDRGASGTLGAPAEGTAPPASHAAQPPFPPVSYTPPVEEAVTAAPARESTARTPRRASGLVLAAVIVGVVALVLGLVPVLGAAAGIAAVILGALVLRSRRSPGLAIVALVLGIIGAITSVLMTLGLIGWIGGMGATEATSAQTAWRSDATTTRR